MSMAGWKRLLIANGRLRAGWRLLIFAALFAGMYGGFALVHAGGLQGLREQFAEQRHITITPWLMIESEAIAMLFLLAAAYIMCRLEHRRFSDYGLPLRGTLGRDFWFGSAVGFFAISGTLLTLYLLDAFYVNGLAVHGTAILSSLLAWGIAYLLSAMFEEFLFRGYVQYTLASAMGYWPAAVAMAVLFGLGHAFNANENAIGSLSVVMFGLLLSLALRRTGNLWCAVGFHSAYDWGQMFYGVPDSGIVPYHNLLHSTLVGPRWLSGGAVGPEASVVTPVALLLAAWLFTRRYRTVRYQAPGPCATCTAIP
jgi:uncharacterized protein